MISIGENLLGSSLNDKRATVNGWQLIPDYNDGVVYVVKAKTHIY